MTTSFLVVTFVASLIVVRGESMAPTLRGGEVALVPRYETWLHQAGIGNFGRGDIVFFRSPTGGEQRIIKRIVAAPGDRIRMDGGALYLDGQLVQEPYLGSRLLVPVNHPETIIAVGHVFVLGDNRAPLGSLDSRHFGPVEVRSLEGRAAVVIWPLFRRVDGALRLNLRILGRGD